MNTNNQRLPYINNARLILLTVGINFLADFYMLFSEQISKSQLLTDAAVFGAVTAVIDTFAVRYLLKKMYLKGNLPAEPLQNRWINCLPQNPFLLASVLAGTFAFLAWLFNSATLAFFERKALLPTEFIVWKLIYAVWFSAFMVRLLIYRYAQPGVFGTDIRQQGSAEMQEIFPPVSTFKEQWNAMLSDFGLNMIMGLIFGATVINPDRSLTIYGAAGDGIVCSALIYAAIVMVLMVYPVIKKIYEVAVSGEIAIPAARPNILARFPRSPWGNTLIAFIPVALISVTFLWSIFAIFHFDTLNFFQFFVLRLILITILTELIVWYATARYSQKLN